MKIPFFHIDAFTPVPYKGNPAAVCILSSEMSDSWMQLVAFEMQLSETAFLLPRGERWGLRWFTPVTEVPLCGHATLASAHALYQSERVAADAAIQFETRSGILAASRREAWIELDFPARPERQVDPPANLEKALGSGFRYIGESAENFLVEFDSEKHVRELAPDFTLMNAVTKFGVIATAKGSGDYDFISRYFAPAYGIPEDPVTGSAHSTLGPFWSERLGKKEMSAYQASVRGGELRVRVTNDRVYLLGQAVTIVRGELLT